MSRAQNIYIPEMLNRIGVVNVPPSSWEVVDGMFPSIVVAHVDRLVSTPAPPSGSCGQFFASGGALWRVAYIHHNESRDIIVHNLRLRLQAVANYHIYAGMAPKTELTSRSMIESGVPDQQLAFMHTGGIRASARYGQTFAPTDPLTWGAGSINATAIAYGSVQTDLVPDLSWIIPSGQVLMFWPGPAQNLSFAAFWEFHEQQPGAMWGSRTLTP